MSTAGNALSAAPSIPLPYVGASVTLASAAVPKSLLALIQALGGNYAACPSVASELTLQCDPASASGIVVCDSVAAASAAPPTSYAYVLQQGQSKTYPNGADLSRIYVGSSTAATAAQVNVEVNGAGGSLRW